MTSLPASTARPEEDDGQGFPGRDGGGYAREGWARIRPRCSPGAGQRRPRQVALSMMNRHGLIAGDRDGQDEDPAAHRRPSSRSGRAGLRGRHQGRPDWGWRARRCDEPKVVEVTSLGAFVGRLTGHASRCQGSSAPRFWATVHSFGPLLLGSPRPQHTRPRYIADLQVLRRQRYTAARPQGPRPRSSTCLRRWQAVLADYGGMSAHRSARAPAQSISGTWVKTVC